MDNEFLGCQTTLLINAIIFNLEDEEYENKEDIFDLVFMRSFLNVVKYYVDNNSFSEKIKDNIRNYLFKAREYKDNNRDKRIDIINEIIITLNNQKEDNSLGFYRLELYKRRRDLKFAIKADNDTIKKEIDAIHDSICGDLYVIYTHSDSISDQKFINEHLPNLSNSAMYYESINALIMDYPYIFKDRIFYNRMMCVLNLNNELYNDDKEMINLNKKLVKKVNRKVKRIK